VRTVSTNLSPSAVIAAQRRCHLEEDIRLIHVAREKKRPGALGSDRYARAGVIAGAEPDRQAPQHLFGGRRVRRVARFANQG
jgi:hypothetical protein